MRKNLLLSNIAFILLFSLFMISCQNEESVEEGTEQNENTFSTTSAMAGYLSGIGMNAGAADNFLDDSSSISFQLPVTILVNGFEVTVNTPGQFQQIMNILNASDTDTDEVTYSYPIVIITADYTTITINSDEELQTVLNEYENTTEEPVECIDFVYPITFYTFDANQEIVDEVEVNSDAQLYLFFASLQPAYFVSMQFPVLVTVNGETETVTSNNQLQELLETCTGSATGGGGSYYEYSISEILQQLETCTWDVTYLLVNEYDLTGAFENSYLTFEDNNEVILTLGADSYPGSWTVGLSATGDYVLAIEFDTFTQFSNTWQIVSITETTVTLEAGADALTLEMNCDNEPVTSTCNEQEIGADLQECIWKVTDYNGSDSMGGYNLMFDANGGVQFIGVPSLDTYFTDYIVGLTTVGVMIQFGNITAPEVQGLSGSWRVVDCAEGYLELYDEIGGNSATLEKECSACDLVFESCSDDTGITTFFLNDYEECILSYFGLANSAAASYTVSFYPDEVSATTGSNALIPVYTSQSNQEVIYVRIENNNSGTFLITTITLLVNTNC